jgi:hypothetical protein
MERWLSGRKQLTANELTWATGSLGSNPSLSEKFTASNRQEILRPHLESYGAPLIVVTI